MNVALWIVQVLLAALFAFAGGMKLLMPIEKIAAQGPLLGSMGVGLIRFIGVAELAGALGLILPAATRIAPKLTPTAAVGLLVIMVLAFGLHASRGEWSHEPVVVIAGLLAAFVVWGRFKKRPIASR